MEILKEKMSYDELHCGPLAIARFLSIPVEQVLKDWPSKWTDRMSDKNRLGIPIDTHIHHKAYLKSKGFGMTMLEAPRVGAIVLLSKSMFNRHWAMINSVSEDKVVVDWLTGDLVTLSRLEFEELFEAWPKFMYRITTEQIKLSWWEKLFLLISR